MRLLRAMAQAPTLYDFQIALSNVDRAIDQPQLGMKVARHPSETMERLWLRVIAFCLHWEERLAFGPGLSDPDTPDIECRDYTGRVTRWIRVGKADPAKIKRAVEQNADAKVAVLFESQQRMDAFLTEAREAKSTSVARADLAAIGSELLSALGKIDERRIKVSLTFVGDHLYIDCGGESFDGPLTRGAV